MSILVALNIFAAVIIFVYCACKLSLRHWKWHESGLWINAMLIGGAVGSVFISLLNQKLPEWPEILINWGALRRTGGSEKSCELCRNSHQALRRTGGSEN